MTPTATPMVEIKEMSEMNACLRFARGAPGDVEFEGHTLTTASGYRLRAAGACGAGTGERARALLRARVRPQAGRRVLLEAGFAPIILARAMNKTRG